MTGARRRGADSYSFNEARLSRLVRYRSARALLSLVALALLVSCTARVDAGTTGDPAGDPAVWELHDHRAVSPGSTEFTIAVSRVSCSSGFTGEVLTPAVTYEPTRIMIRVEVEPVGDGPQTCQGNPPVPVSVTLIEPVGHRDLVDAGCDHGLAAETVMCEDPVRWSPGS